MQGNIRIALEVRLYEEVLRTFHEEYRGLVEAGFPEENPRKWIIRRLEANAYEVTWKRPNRGVPWFGGGPIQI